jgi:hypothetical protein
MDDVLSQKMICDSYQKTTLINLTFNKKHMKTIAILVVVTGFLLVANANASDLP